MAPSVWFRLALAVALAAGTAVAGRVRLTRPGQRHMPGAVEQQNRLVRNYTSIQQDLAPLARFRFKPTEKDMWRAAKLRAGGYDTVRVLCLRVEFVEDTTPLTTGNGKMDTFGFLVPDSGLFYDPPHFKRYFERQMEGLRNYYLAQSLGHLYVDFTVLPEDEKTCYQLPREMQFYGDTTSFLAIELGLVRLMRDAFKVADETDPDIHFGDYDEFIVFHAGSGLQADFGLRRDSPFDLLAGEIPSGAIEAYLGEPYIVVDSGRTLIEQGTVLPEMMRQDTMYEGETNILGMTGLAGTLVHEFAHLLGAYDLYDVTGYTMGVGSWSLMGYGGWLGDYGAGAPPGVIPGFLDAYHRVKLGFIRPLVVNAPRDSVPVYAAQMDTTLYSARGDTSPPTIVKIPITEDEYFLVENRQIDVRQPDTIDVDVEDGVVISVAFGEYDFFQPSDTAYPRGGSGLLIWHVDERVIADYGPYNAVNIFPERKGVDLEEGDGVQDFDVVYWESRNPEYEIYGHKFDPFFVGGYNDRFTARTNPNTDGYAGKSFISVTLLGERDSTVRLKDTIMSINVAWDLYQRGFPKTVGAAPLKSAFAADIYGSDTLALAVLDTAGNLRVWRSDGTLLRSLGVGSPASADLAIGDVAGDAKLEVVVAGNDGLVRMFPTTGAPLRMRTGDRIVAAPVLVDLDGDGKKEIIVGSTDMKLYAWKGDSSLVPGFPIHVGAEIRAAVAVTDTVRPQMVLLSGDGRLFLFNPDASLAAGFPVVLSRAPFYASTQPLVGDFNRDGSKEILVVAPGDHDCRLFVVSLDGRMLHQSGEFIRSPFTGMAAAADVNGDGYPDVLAASWNELFALNHHATLVTNYPLVQDSTYQTTELAGNWIITFDAYFVYASSPVVADVDGDGTPDVVIGSPRSGLLAFDGRTGRALDRFPLLTGASVSAVPLAVDLDRDGDVELAVGSDSGIFYVWDLPGPAGGIRWPCAYHDPCHTGLVREFELGPAPRSRNRAVEALFVYPNPASDSAKVRYQLGSVAQRVRVRLLDMAGDPVGEELEGSATPNIDNEKTLDLRRTPPGMYAVRLTVTVDGRTEVRFTKLAIVR
jgi:M6 family metalloprotease-like protein